MNNIIAFNISIPNNVAKLISTEINLKISSVIHHKIKYNHHIYILYDISRYY